MNKRRLYTPRHAQRLAPETESSLMQRARRLPFSGPGIVITVSLSLLPAYLELHHLVPLDREEICKRRERGIIKPDGVVWVKRIQAEDWQNER